MNTLTPGFALDAVIVEPLAGSLSGPGGRETLDPKVMDVLVHMAGHSGRVVLRDELLARFWPNVVVTGDALTRCFYELRRGLARAGGAERYRAMIETIPKRGYRLNAEVRPLQPPPAASGPPAARSRRAMAWKALGSAAALLAVAAAAYLWRAPDPAKPAAYGIAVLPFLDMSASQDQGYFSDGIAEEILNRLSQAENLRVISRTSSFALRGENLDVPRIADRLGVDYVLEGSVRRAGDRIRVTAQLIDAATNAHLWSETYDRGVGDIFAVQDEVAHGVAQALEVTLTGKDAPARAPPSLEAYESFLQGQFLHHRRSPGDVERSIEYLEKAVALDPGYAQAWAALAGAYALLANPDDAAGAACCERQGAAAKKAVELDPRSAVAQSRLGQYYFQTNDLEKGREHLRLAQALDPDDLLVLGFSATRANFRGDSEEALEIWRRIAAKDPLSPVSRSNLGHFLMLNGRFDEAIVEFRRALELNPGAPPALRAQLAAALILQDRHADAKATIATLPEGADRDYALSLLYRSPGDEADADAALERLVQTAADSRTTVLCAEALSPTAAGATTPSGCSRGNARTTSATPLPHPARCGSSTRTCARRTCSCPCTRTRAGLR